MTEYSRLVGLALKKDNAISNCCQRFCLFPWPKNTLFVATKHVFLFVVYAADRPSLMATPTVLHYKYQLETKFISTQSPLLQREGTGAKPKKRWRLTVEEASSSSLCSTFSCFMPVLTLASCWVIRLFTLPRRELIRLQSMTKSGSTRVSEVVWAAATVVVTAVV